MKFRKNELNLDESNKTYMLNEPVECFCGEESNTIVNVPVAEENRAVVYAEPVKNIPHCPTCGSTNVIKISLGSSVVFWNSVYDYNYDLEFYK